MLLLLDITLVCIKPDTILHNSVCKRVVVIQKNNNVKLWNYDKVTDGVFDCTMNTTSAVGSLHVAFTVFVFCSIHVWYMDIAYVVYVYVFVGSVGICNGICLLRKMTYLYNETSKSPKLSLFATGTERFLKWGHRCHGRAWNIIVFATCSWPQGVHELARGYV